MFDDRSGAIVGRCDGVAATTRDARSLGRGARGLRDRALAARRRNDPLRIDDCARSGHRARAAAPTAVAITLRDGDYPAAPACFSEAKKTVRYLVDGSLHLDDVAADATAAAAGLAAWDETGDRFLAWHCVVTPRADGRWSGRIALRRRRLDDRQPAAAIAASAATCRPRRGAIDANIAHPGDYVDVDAALLGAQNFLVVRGRRALPGAIRRTEPHQP